MFQYQNYDLLNKLTQDEVNTILVQCQLYNQCKDDLLKLPYIFPTTNFVAVCKFVDYYVLSNDSEFINSIICEIFIQNPEVINNISNIPLNLLQKIHKNKNVERWLREKNQYGLKDATRFGYLYIIKYLFEFRDYSLYTRETIELAIKYGHADVLKYLLPYLNKRQMFEGFVKGIISDKDEYRQTKPDSFIE